MSLCACVCVISVHVCVSAASKVAVPSHCWRMKVIASGGQPAAEGYKRVYVCLKHGAILEFLFGFFPHFTDKSIRPSPYEKKQKK